MVPFASTASGQIRFLLNSSNDSDHASAFRELCQFVDYGLEGCILLLQNCLDHLNAHGGDLQNVKKPELVSAVFRYLLGRPNFSTAFCESLRSTSMSEGFLGSLSKALNLSTPEKVGIGLALYDSENPDFRMRGQNFCIAQIEELCLNPTVMSDELIQDIVMFLFRSEGLAKHVDSFTKMLSLLQLKEKTPFILAPMVADHQCSDKSLRHLDMFSEFLEDDFDSVLAEIEKEMSMADIMRELGYGCTVNSAHCKDVLSLFLPLNEVTLAKILSTIAQTHCGLEDSQSTHTTFCSALGSSADSSLLSSWNVEILVDSIKQLVPEMNWIRVMENLDHEGFYIPDEGAFTLFMSIYANACQDPFPLHAVCSSVWKNAEGQLSFLKYAVSVQPEVFSFAHSSRQLTNAELQRIKSTGGNVNQAWSCLDLLEVLCQLAERGHASSVRVMLENPLRQCPEILLVTIAHVNTAYNLIQYEVFSTVFPVMVGNASKSGIVHHLWHVNPNIVLWGFIDAHATNPDIISRISDLCQEFKILASVLDTAPFHFSIKLAAFAFRMEHVNLEKWIYENLSAYKDAFFEDCLKFLKAIPSDGAADLSTNPNQYSSALINVYQDASSIFFKVLQAQAGQLMSDQLPEELKKLQVESVHFNPMMQGAGGSDSSPPTDGSSDNIEIVANAYFHQMFSGQLSIEGMVQMLARFKESSDKREKAIFECMINNLFEEYKFFPKYPEMQLKIVSVLFGSLIKHQLVTHLTLGVALRAVLDALRKSVDSKMFMFGAKALEQFVDRLVEWPQYCNHILQISHMRSTHAELVSFIERALARISSSQSESNGGNIASIDHQGSANATTEEESEISWQLMNSGTMQSGQQFSSSTMVQPRHHGFLEDRAKSTVASVNYMKPSSPAGQPSLVSLGADIVSNQKAIASQSLQSVSSSLASSVPLSVSSSSGFLRSTRGITPAGRQHSYSTGFGAALNIETLVAAAERRDTPIETPASEIQDKILFMINNLSATNMDAKAKEFIEILKEEYYPWFAQYIVMKRASIEPNFHDLYLKFLDKVNSKSLNKEIVKATYENCKVLLRSELIKSSSEERSLLKNLGSWLGKFTIGRNQALRAREIDPKALIIEAYEKGLMIAVIPFTSKILEPCQSSLAYQPPNPWTMGILGLLVEIYALPNLKMNLKFDIEVLFKNLGVDMKDVKPTSLLKDRVREVEGNPDFSNKDIAASQPTVVADNTGMISTLNQVEIQPEVVSASRPSSHSNLLTQYTAPHHLASSTLMEDDKLGNIGLPERIPPGPAMSQVSPSQSPLSSSQLLSPISNMGIHVVINQKLNALGLPFQRIVPIAMDRAIKDIVTPVVQRSVSIASQTTKELVPKDYALEADENRIFNASHLMVASLAGSLAHVSCKELLRTALSNNLRSLLQTLNVGSDLLEQTVQLITNDNLDLGCAIIEQATTDKALLAIDGEIASQLSIRKNKRNASAFYDANPYAQGFARVPEALRPKPGRLSAAQQRVYDDFVRFPWQNQPSQSSSALNAQPLSSGNLAGSSGPRGYNSSPNRLNSTLFSSAQVTPGFGTQSLDLISEDMEPGPTQLLSTSAHSGISDGVIQNAAEISTVASPFPPTVVTSDLNLVEMSSVVKELGSVVQPSPTTPTERLGISIPEQLLTTGDALEKYQIVAQKLETVIAKDIQDAEIPGIIAEVPEIILKCISRDEAALAVAQKVFKSLYENASNNVHVSSHLAILTSIRDVCKLVVKELTSWVIYSDEERKFNKDITVGLIRSELLNLAEYNVHLAKLIDGGRNKAATEFAISLVQTLVSQEPGVSMSEFYNVIDALTKLAMRPGSPESLQQLVDIARNPSANSIPLSGFVNKEEKGKQLRDKKVASVRSMTNREEYGAVDSAVTDPAGFRDQVSVLFSEWCRICELPVTNDASHTHFISQLHQSGLLKGDDVTDRFFRILTELSVGHCLSLEGQSSQQTQYLFVAIDMYAKLVYLVVKYWPVDQGLSKVILLPKVLSVTGRVIQKDADEKKTSFNPRPYFRLFINWLLDLTSDPALEVANLQVLTYFANAFHALQPLKVPGWSFVWLELVSHRSFMPKLLTINNQKGWPFIQRLLIDLFKFMEPYLRNAELGESVHFLYKGTLRVLLVLLHDFPEFLCDYHFSFCDVIPPSCIQMRNVILSAFPRNMRLPDPSTPNLKIDLLPEITVPPRILSEVDGALKAKQMKADIDEYFKTRQPGSSFLTELKQKLYLPSSEAALSGTRYNVPLINSLVLYVGIQAISLLQNKSSLPTPQNLDILSGGAAMDIFQVLVGELDTEGRYLFLNAVANQLRYPNNHTHYFSFVLLYLFAETNQDIIQEQITRVLLERLIVNRPHPWGLLITFIELIKNPRYNFWNRSFTHCAPEIERLFDTVARSCGGPKAVDDGMVSGNISDNNH